MRAGWDETWQTVAGAIALRSACELRQVGAVVVSPGNDQHWVGYNGPPAPWRPARPYGVAPLCSHYCPQAALGANWCVSIHAEVNALMKSDPVQRRGGLFVVTAGPCWKCALAIANSGVARVSWPTYEPEREDLSIKVSVLMEQCGIEEEPWPGTPTLPSSW